MAANSLGVQVIPRQLHSTTVDLAAWHVTDADPKRLVYGEESNMNVADKMCVPLAKV